MPAPHAPTRPLWVALLSTLFALAPAWTGPVHAQDEPEAKADESKADEPNAGEPEPKASAVESEQWAEPMRFALLENTFPELPSPFFSPNDENAVRRGARTGSVDAALVKRYVQHFTGELTKHTNIESVLNDTGDSRGAIQIEKAADALLRPLLEDISPANRGFRQAYLNDLMEVAPKLMQGHLHTRTFFMVVLSKSKSPEVVPFLIEQLQSDDQPMTVKMLAAAGLVNIAQGGRNQLDPNSLAIPASRALSGWLEANPDLFWPLKSRALEAIGSMRQATGSPLRGEAELAAEPFRLLADPAQRPDVRAWAAWALGMLDVPAQVRQFNFRLVAYAIGRAAADLGTEIVEIPVPEDAPAKNLRLVERRADPLLRILLALAGDPKISRSGLAATSHPVAIAARGYARDIEQRVRAVATSTLNMTRSVGRQVPDAHKRLAADVQELRSFLAKNPPESAELYPGGPTLELPSTAPAGAKSPAAAEPKKGNAGGNAR